MRRKRERVIAAWKRDPDPAWISRCRTPQGAYANCLAVSAAFSQQARELGLAAGLVELRFSARWEGRGAGRWPFVLPGSHSHWVSLLGEETVDWTARQFQANAAYPLISSPACLREEWGEVILWACPHSRLIQEKEHLRPAPLEMEETHRILGSTGTGLYPDPRHPLGESEQLLAPTACPACQAAWLDGESAVMLPPLLPALSLGEPLSQPELGGPLDLAQPSELL